MRRDSRTNPMAMPDETLHIIQEELYTTSRCSHCGEHETCWFCPFCQQFVCHDCAWWDEQSYGELEEDRQILVFRCDVCDSRLEILLQ